MCDICVMNAVKDRMLSRRSLFKGAAMAGAAAALGTTAATPTQAASHGGGPVDMTHTLSSEFPTWGGKPGFATKTLNQFDKDGYTIYNLSIDEHTGTHIDAPLHFSADGTSVDEIPVTQLVAPLCVIDIAARAEGNPDAQVTPDDLKAWIAAHGEIPDNACVAMHSGWGTKTGSDDFRGFDGTALHFPGFHVEATNMLMEETGATSIAVDTLSLDHGPSPDFAVHYSWLPSGRFGIECVANLDKMPPAGATLVIGAPKHKGGTGGPARLIALT